MCVKDLLNKLPSSMSDATRRTNLSAHEIHEDLYKLICTGDLTQPQADRIAPLFKVLGPSHHTDDYIRIFHSTDSNTSLKERALSALFHSPAGLELFGELNASDRVEYCGPWLRPMVALASSEDDMFPRVALAALYRATPEEFRMKLIYKITSFMIDHKDWTRPARVFSELRRTMEADQMRFVCNLIEENFADDESLAFLSVEAPRPLVTH